MLKLSLLTPGRTGGIYTLKLETKESQSQSFVTLLLFIDIARPGLE